MTALSLRGPMVLGLCALLVLVLGFGLWAISAELSGAVIAQGRIVAEGRNLPLQHPDGGLVADVLVQDGDRVTAGQVLVRLDGAALRSDLAIVQGRLGEISARISRLEAERDGKAAPDFPPALLRMAEQDPLVAAQLTGQRDLMAARAATEADLAAQLRQRKAQAGARLRGLEAQIVAVEELSRLAKEELAQKQALFAKGLTPQDSLRQLQRDVARLSGEGGELAAAAAAIGDQIAELDIQLSGLAAQRREEATRELRELWPLQIELEERARHLEGRIARLDLRAPVAGVVLGQQVAAPGMVLQAGEAALHLVPTAGLQVSARVAPLQVGRIAQGQVADLVFPSRDQSQDIRLMGQVALVSADLLTDPQTGVGTFEIRIDLPPAALTDLHLQPGMPVDVYLRTGSRPAIAYLVDPFSRYFAHALREG